MIFHAKTQAKIFSIELGPWRSAKTIGLSVAEFISVVMMPRTKSMVSWQMPCTCGQHRSVYASCTRSQKRWLSETQCDVQACKLWVVTLQVTQLRLTCDFGWVSLRMQERPQSSRHQSLARVWADLVNVWKRQEFTICCERLRELAPA